MSIKKSFLMELQHELTSTKKIIACVPADKWDWKPHEKSMTLGKLAKHIVELTFWTESMAKQPVFDLHVDYVSVDAKSAEDLLKAIDAHEAAVMAAIDSMTDEQWMDTWTLKAGEHTIMQMPKVGANRFVVNNHIYHHRGQLSVYLRLLDIPVPGMYGPSADDLK